MVVHAGLLARTGVRLSHPLRTWRCVRRGRSKGWLVSKKQALTCEFLSVRDEANDAVLQLQVVLLQTQVRIAASSPALKPVGHSFYSTDPARSAAWWLRLVFVWEIPCIETKQPTFHPIPSSGFLKELRRYSTSQLLRPRAA